MDNKAQELFSALQGVIAPAIKAFFKMQSAREAEYHGQSDQAVTHKDGVLRGKEMNETAVAIVEAEALAAKLAGTSSPTAGLMEFFRVPWGVSNTDLITKANAMVDKAEEFATRFLELGWEADFFTALRARITAFETTGTEQEEALGEQTGASESIDPEIQKGLVAIKQVGVICRRRYRSNPQKLGEWEAASHVERVGGNTLTALEIESTEVTGPATVKFIYDDTGAEKAEIVVLQKKAPGDADYVDLGEVVEPEQTVTDAAWTAGTHVDFRTKATRGEESVFSDPVPLDF